MAFWVEALIWFLKLIDAILITLITSNGQLLLKYLLELIEQSILEETF